MLRISSNIFINDFEVELLAIRAQGNGGQNVNKVSSAIHLRFDIKASSLPDFHKQRLLASQDSRINKLGILVIKAQRFRTQEKNKKDALDRLCELITTISEVKKIRRPTRATYSSKRKRIDKKVNRGKIKTLRAKNIID